MFTADARFVLSGSDDGNVRVWKANASEKLGVITARERAAIEYRETLKDKWKADQQVGKVQRYVSFTFALFIADLDISGAAIYRSRCTRPVSSNGPCSRRSASRRRGVGSTHALERANRRLRNKSLYLPSRHSVSPVFYLCLELYSLGTPCALSLSSACSRLAVVYHAEASCSEFYTYMSTVALLLHPVLFGHSIRAYRRVQMCGAIHQVIVFDGVVGAAAAAGLESKL